MELIEFVNCRNSVSSVGKGKFLEICVTKTKSSSADEEEDQKEDTTGNRRTWV
jgi:hypothetical protein